MHDAQPDVQRLTAADVDAASALARVVWQATYPSLISQAQIDAMLADRYAPERIREQLGDPHQAWWVTKQNHTLTGFAHALLHASGCKLDKLYVHPDSQRQGIGGTLLRTVEAWARTQQTRRLPIDAAGQHDGREAVGGVARSRLACVQRQQYATPLTFGPAPLARPNDCLVPVSVRKQEFA
jgi:GNAT superfamily N-acetyltransferase